MPSGFAATSQTGQVFVIDPSALAQQFQGFGTSLAWWANIIGTHFACHCNTCHSAFLILTIFVIGGWV
jgi:hypothetical protein